MAGGARILRAIVDEEVRVGENCVIGGEGAIAVIGMPCTGGQ